MKLLIVTQVVDTEDPVLGFFTRWIDELAARLDQVTVICLKKGAYRAPHNVRVYSLGKERGRAGGLTYGLRFLRLAWRLRHDYGAVFVHMNQEYVLIAGWLWKILGKRVYMWRNHYAGSWLTDVAAAFCDKVFCTSKHSYTAKYKKTQLMPVGVDTTRFCPDERVVRKPHSILFLARIAPSKRVEMLIDALGLLKEENVPFTATIVGSPLPQDAGYYQSLKERMTKLGLDDRVTFVPAVPNHATPDLYRAHEIFVNTSPSGMFDKTLMEALACSCYVLTTILDGKSIGGLNSYVASAEDLAAKARIILSGHRQPLSYQAVTENSLETLCGRLVGVMLEGGV